MAARDDGETTMTIRRDAIANDGSVSNAIPLHVYNIRHRQPSSSGV